MVVHGTYVWHSMVQMVLLPFSLQLCVCVMWPSCALDLVWDLVQVRPFICSCSFVSERKRKNLKNSVDNNLQREQPAPTTIAYNGVTPSRFIPNCCHVTMHSLAATIPPQLGSFEDEDLNGATASRGGGGLWRGIGVIAVTAGWWTVVGRLGAVGGG